MNDQPPPLPEIRNRVNLLAWRERYRAWQTRRQQRVAAARVDARRALEATWRGPPVNVRRVGSWIGWHAPEHSDRHPPDRYWVHTSYDGGRTWSVEGTTLPRRAREYVARGHVDALRIEAYWDNEVSGLGPRYLSPVMHAGPEPEWLVPRVRYYAAELHGVEHRRRWRRVLVAMGAVEGYRQFTRRCVPVVPRLCPVKYPPMTLAEIRDCHAKYSPVRWAPVLAWAERNLR